MDQSLRLSDDNYEAPMRDNHASVQSTWFSTLRKNVFILDN